VGDSGTATTDSSGQMTDEHFAHLYGPWDTPSVEEVRGWLDGWEAAWWVAGGQSIEQFTGVTRRHDDLDIAFFRRDIASLHAHLGPRFHLWAAGSGTLRPLGWEAGRPTTDVRLPDWSGQVWVREHALSPWRVDFVATPDREGRWVFKRDETCSAPLDEVTEVAEDGVRYQRPEVTLAFKAHLARPKDHADFAAALPLLSASQRGWLTERLRALYPDGHEWEDRLSSA
jgi:hypothetical protein